MATNAYFWFVLAVVVGFYLLDLIANVLNLKALGRGLPKGFEDVFDEETYDKSQAYHREGTRFEFIKDAFGLAAFLLFWLLGGFPWLDGIVRGLGDFPDVVYGILFIGILIIAQMLISLPFDYYDNFVIEEKYGFNKMTPGLFFMDQIKGLAVLAALGLPFIALILWILGSLPAAWLYAWVATVAYMIFTIYIYPTVVLPLFNKFTPLEEGELKSAIDKMSEDCEFPISEVNVMDGSKRSSKTNAFFSGFGKTKKIALFDTLIEKHPTDELVAVLAHEIGHFKLRHVIRMVVISALTTGLSFFFLSLFMEDPALFAAFGSPEPSVYLSIIFFSFLYQPLAKLLSIFTSALSRKHEFEADAFAAEATGKAEAMIAALKRLPKDNLSNLTPHPLYAFLYYSHPPVPERVEALEGRE